MGNSTPPFKAFAETIHPSVFSDAAEGSIRGGRGGSAPGSASSSPSARLSSGSTERRATCRARGPTDLALTVYEGSVISRRIEKDGWGKGTVEELSSYLSRTERGGRGFSPQNLWRMQQFFETYRGAPEVSTLVRELPWSANLHILSGAKRPEEREFYLRMAIHKRWNVRELARQIEASAFERTALVPPKLSTALRELDPGAADDFKDVYSLEFTDLATGHSEADLPAALLRNLGRFITELGRDFCFVGSEYPVQVGNQDFAVDLVFFHRGLSCLVAFELKVRRFQPEDLGKLSFYVEALDRDVRKPHERPSIGVLLCATKDDEVVDYVRKRRGQRDEDPAHARRELREFADGRGNVGQPPDSMTSVEDPKADERRL